MFKYLLTNISYKIMPSHSTNLFIHRHDSENAFSCRLQFVLSTSDKWHLPPLQQNLHTLGFKNVALQKTVPNSVGSSIQKLESSIQLNSTQSFFILLNSNQSGFKSTCNQIKLDPNQTVSKSNLTQIELDSNRTRLKLNSTQIELDSNQTQLKSNLIQIKLDSN